MSENWYFVGAAYAVTWIVLGAYRLFLRARRREALELVRKEAQL